MYRPGTPVSTQKQSENTEKTTTSSPTRAPREKVFEFVRHLARDLSSGEFELPPFPDTALRVQRCVRDPNSCIQDLAAIVATEPALAARLMRMANSAMMRRGPFEVTDIDTAISRVGMSMVQSVAVSFAAREAFQLPPGSLCLDDLNQLRQQSVRAAAICYVLSHSLGSRVASIKNADEAMLAGLLNAVGKFYIFTRAGDHPELFQDRDSLEGLIAEWHTGVARAIVESWEFPETVAIAVGEWEVEERDCKLPADLSDVLFVANHLTCASASAPDAARQLGDVDAVKRMCTTADELASILEEHDEELQSMTEAMSH